ncbi:MAG: hypothetical protein AAF193_09035, partial [Bacteroidota bacterium]
LYAGISTGLYLLFVRSSIKDNLLRQVVLICAIAFGVMGIVGSILYKDDFPSIFIMGGIVFIIAGCLLVFMDMLQNIPDTKASRNPTLIITVSIFLYHSIFFCHLGSINGFLKLGTLNDTLVTIHRYVSIVFYGMFGYTFLLSRWNSRKLESA